MLDWSDGWRSAARATWTHIRIQDPQADSSRVGPTPLAATFASIFWWAALPPAVLSIVGLPLAAVVSLRNGSGFVLVPIAVFAWSLCWYGLMLSVTHE